MESEAKLDCLPTEILAIIFSYLTTKEDFRSVFWTCKIFAEAMCLTKSQNYQGKGFIINKKSNFLIKNRYYNIKSIPNNKFIFNMLSKVLHNSVIRLNVENQQDMDKLLKYGLLQDASELRGHADISVLSSQLGKVKKIELDTPNLETVEPLKFTEILKLEEIKAHTLTYFGHAPNLKTLVIGDDINRSIELHNLDKLEFLSIKKNRSLVIFII